MRFSSYSFGAPLPGSEFMILGHGMTGAVDKMHGHIGDKIVSKRGGECPSEFLEELSEPLLDNLVSRGYLTPLTRQEERARFTEIAARIHLSEISNTAANYMLIPTYRCNLRCPYCFQSHEMHAGRGDFAQDMTVEQVDAIFRIIDTTRPRGLLARQAGMIDASSNDAPIHRSRITLFGGEPLQYSTRDIVTYILDCATTRGDRLSAVTNGVELEHYVDLLGPGLIEEVQITLDGPMAMHDKRRIGPGYPKTFEKIVQNVELALAKSVQTSLRLNIDSRNPDGVDRLNEFFVERGWSKHPNFMSYAAVVHDASTSLSSLRRESGEQTIQFFPKGYKFPTITEADLAARTESLKTDNDSCIGSYESFAQDFLRNALGQSEYPFFKTSHCSAETGLLIFDSLWNVYTCWEEAGLASRRVATYDLNGLNIDPARLLPWLSRQPGVIEQCSECAYALIHTSGCGKHAFDTSGTLFASACESFQDYFPVTFAAAYASIESRLFNHVKEAV